MKSFRVSPFIAVLLVTFACSDAAPPAPDDAAARTASNEPRPLPADQTPPPRSVTQNNVPEELEIPRESFNDGARAFNEVKNALLKSYYAEGMSEDDVYRAATAGMLAQLEPRMRKYNKLLSPTEIAEVKNDLKGEVVGVGIQISFDEKSGYTDVLGTIAGSPSEKAGLVAGDKIVTVDGKLYKGMKLRDVVADIRGKVGTSVTLSVLRGDKLLPFTLTRDRLVFDAPSASFVGAPDDKLGYVRIPSFTEKTPAAVRAGLEELAAKGARALVIDLRHSPGGSFDRALETAELLLPEGAPIVTLQKKGKPEETHVSKGKPILGDVPAAVLVDEMTASGAELLASALREQRHAKLVGARTYGKWSVQALDDLPNGWAYKYTLGLFKIPAGKSYEGTGVSPDVELAMDEGALGRANHGKPEERLTIDVQLRTARELLLRAP
ncbi:MAG: S41 family peptidase [Labilithrix sp.]|nr:S41 family peptidase [Labilithrix sp.]MCW5815084.1 S41 family peptidase [Labilithrix sp.]